MSARQSQIKYNLLTFFLLFTVSLYRRISLRFWPEDRFRTYILYACYYSLCLLPDSDHRLDHFHSDQDHAEDHENISDP